VSRFEKGLRWRDKAGTRITEVLVLKLEKWLKDCEDFSKKGKREIEGCLEIAIWLEVSNSHEINSNRNTALAITSSSIIMEDQGTTYRDRSIRSLAARLVSALRRRLHSVYR
jgi:hypothetical protein